MKKGIDVSSWQPKIDYVKVKNSGIEFVILRCGYGKNSWQKDKYFETHYEGFKKVGMPVGAYLYSYASNVSGALKEAKNCLKFIKGKEFEFPVFYDLEDASTTGKASKQVVTDMAIAFCEEIKKVGYVAGIYANKNWFENKMFHDKLEKYKIWWAQYTTAKNPTTSKKVDMWQYSSSGKVDGIEGNVDMDYCLCDCIEEVRFKNGDKVKVELPVLFTGSVEGRKSLIEFNNMQGWVLSSKLNKEKSILKLDGIVAYPEQNRSLVELKVFDDYTQEWIENIYLERKK